MTAPQSTVGTKLRLWRGVIVAASLWIWPTAGLAQIGSIPEPFYYQAIEEFYSGDYRGAERDFRRMVRSGIKTVQARWIDSICYHAMLGEVLYQQGRNPEALVEFDQACQLVLSYPKWLLQVRFTDAPRPNPNRARRVVPWGQSKRQAVLADVDRTMLVRLGEVQVLPGEQGGALIDTSQFWKVDAVEIIRCSTLAIRRRNEMLGPLAEYDPISKSLAASLSARGLAPLNHWSSAWVDLQAGVAQAGIGRVQEALTHLSRAVVLAGQFDHSLTCIVLLEQGKLAMAGGNSQAAANFFAEASYSAYYYEDWGVLQEALRLGHINHITSNGAGAYPPLENAAGWTRTAGLHALETEFKLAHVETLATMGQWDAAGALLNDVGRRLGEMRTALPGVYQLYLQALVQLGQGRTPQGHAALEQALAAQAAVSLRNFQIVRLNGLVDSREASARIAADLYGRLLDDPTPGDWTLRPLDSLAYLLTDHDEAFDRWFLSALERKDAPLAFEIAERTKRRRFHESLPLGGRILSLAWLLDSSPRELSQQAALERNNLLTTFPDYRKLVDELRQIQNELRGQPIAVDDAAVGRERKSLVDQWQKMAGQRESLLSLMAVRRIPAPMAFPPLKASAELQKGLSPGQVVVAFHAAAGNLYGFALTAGDETAWQVGPMRQVQTDLTKLLEALGNYGAGRDISAVELAGDDWRAAAERMFETLFADSHLAFDEIRELVVVPDDVLWYSPLEACALPKLDGGELLIDRMRIRYVPTAGLAVGANQPFRRIQHSGIVAGSPPSNEAQQTSFTEQLDRLKATMNGAVLLTSPLPMPTPLLITMLDELVVLDDLEFEPAAPYDWSPLPRERRRNAEGLAAWFAFPSHAPERVVLTGLPTAAETGLKGSRRGSARAAAPGVEMFRAVCALMAGGTRTALISRWRTGGQLNFDLVHEFVQELPHVAGTEAWQRSVLLAREAALDPGLEPRLKRGEKLEEAPTANHPFFWAGYMLVDTGYDPAAGDEDVAADVAQPPAVQFKPVPPQAGGAKETPPAEPRPTQPPSGK